MSISLQGVIPKLISAKVLRDLEKNLVATKICTAPINAPITKMGDTVYFPSMASPTITAYTGADITFENIKDASTALLIDKAYSYSFQILDVDNFQAQIDVAGGCVESAMYGLRDTMDAAVFDLDTQAGNILTEAGVTSVTIQSAIARMARTLDEQNVPSNGRWLAISPIVKERMVLAGIYFKTLESIGTLEVADYLGFKVYVSNNINFTSTGETQVPNILAGSTNSIAFAQQIVKSAVVEREANFGTGYKGLAVWGAKVIKPKELVSNALTFVAETVI
jgi:hypothetical protein